MGYLILKDAVATLGRKLSDDEYRALRDLVDFKLEPEAVSPELVSSLGAILSGARADFNPDVEHYRDYMNRWNDRLMALVEKRTVEAVFEKGKPHHCVPTRYALDSATSGENRNARIRISPQYSDSSGGEQRLRSDLPRWFTLCERW